jgi:hypothetical protein
MKTTHLRIWRILQSAVWLLGVAILAALFFLPEIGLHAFWNILIPVAPALLAIAPGVWRNICPLASTALMGRHAGLSRRKPVSVPWQGRLFLLGVLLLYAIVPLRHVVMDLSGFATGVAIVSLAVVSVVMGTRFEWKSGWCSGMCPVHPVERLYGSAAVVSPPNAHCHPCEQCVQPCPDATNKLDPLSANGTTARSIAGYLMVGGFAGFIWGWFQVPDYADGQGWSHLAQAFGWPMLGTACTLAMYFLLRGKVSEQPLNRSFAAAAIACYYWYRLPMLFGFGPFPGDGMLIDLTDTLGPWFTPISRFITTAFFAWWLVGRKSIRRSWLIRPPMAKAATSD